MLIDISQLKFPKRVCGVIHIGAHECEERMLYLTKFPNITDNEIIWIEALKSKVETIKLQNPNIRIFNECISNTDNEIVTFHVTNNIQSSSFLNLKDHLIEHPHIYEVEQIEIKTKTLRTFYQENNFNYNQFNFMALDIQGAELLALKGAEEILNFVDYIYIEVNTKELYEKCGLLDEVDGYLSSFGFKRDNIFMTPHGWGDAFYSKHIFPINNPISITYGLDYMNIDITTIIFKNHSTNGIIHIPVTDGLRANLYTDPLFGIIKKLYITNGDSIFTIEHDDFVNIDINNNKLYINENVEYTHNNENTKIEIMESIINKKYTFTIMAIFKNETMNLKVWLDHYLWQGVEHFYLIDNNSNDNPLNILQDYIDRGIVTYYFKPEKHQQVEIYRYVFDNENIKEKTKWLCICDLDEFFFGTTTKLVNVLENEFDNYDVIYTHSFFYGSDNLINHPKDIRTSIVHRTHDTINGIKYIFKPSTINNSSEIWIHWLVEPGTLQKKSGQNETFHDTNFRLNHYICQSLEYFQNVKMTRGDVNNIHNENIRNMDTYYYYEKEAIIKDDILKQIIENNLYDKNGEIMKFYDENNNIIDNNSIDNNSIEYIEQELVNKYILEDDIVLELGARYGTVSCSINKKLKNKHNQISVEPDDKVWYSLEMNKIKNNCNFNIVKGFVSNKKLGLTNDGYGSTFTFDDITQIPSYSLDEIKIKYNINNFNVLVADCEGFLEIFFDENPELYESLRLIIFEADYADKCNYDKIRQKLILNKFCKILEGHQNVWIKPECYQLSNNIKIKYGIRENNVDVTNVVYKNYNNNSVIFIPDGDGYRSNILGDPLHGIIKSIFIHDNEISYIDENIDNIDNIKIFVYGDSHGRFNFKNFLSNDKIQFYNRQEDSRTMFRVSRDNVIINFDKNEHDKNSILCFNYGEIDCRCHIQKQINLGRNENEIIDTLIHKYFQSIQKNINIYKKIVIIAITPATNKYDYEKNYGPITHNSPFLGSDQDRRRYTYKMNKTIEKYCHIYNFIYFDPFSYYKREDESFNHTYSDSMLHLGDNKYFLDKFYSNILFEKKYDIYVISHNKQACIDLTTNKLYIGDIPDIFKMDFSRIEYENISLKYNIDGIKTEPNFNIKIGSNNYGIYKIENVVNYEYKFCCPEINIVKINKPLKQTHTYYFIFDDYGLHAFAHWVYESFIFFPILEELNKLYPNIKILTTNKKKYVRSFINFVGIQNEIVYKIEDYNNVCFISPILSLNHNIDTQLFNHFISNFINRIQMNSINFDYKNEILFLPRNKVDNYFPDDKIDVHLLRERRNQDQIDYISNGVIKNGGIVLNTYEINNFFIQFSLIMNSKNIILDYGSSYFVNCIACKNKNIIVLDPDNISIDISLIESIKNINNIIEKNNKVTILTNYNNYEDIENILL